MISLENFLGRTILNVFITIEHQNQNQRESNMMVIKERRSMVVVITKKLRRRMVAVITKKEREEKMRYYNPLNHFHSRQI